MISMGKRVDAGGGGEGASVMVIHRRALQKCFEWRC